MPRTAPFARFGVFAREEGVGKDDTGFVGGGGGEGAVEAEVVG
jgi:hypothetical protein